MDKSLRELYQAMHKEVFRYNIDSITFAHRLVDDIIENITNETYYVYRLFKTADNLDNLPFEIRFVQVDIHAKGDNDEYKLHFHIDFRVHHKTRIATQWFSVQGIEPILCYGNIPSIEWFNKLEHLIMTFILKESITRLPDTLIRKCAEVGDNVKELTKL